MVRSITGPALALALALVLAPACGDGDGGTQNGREAQVSDRSDLETAYGYAELASEASRIVEVRMLDVQFEPAEIRVDPNEVVTFRVSNEGQMPHELTLGGPTAQELHECKMAAMTGSHGDMDMGGSGHDSMTAGMGGTDEMAGAAGCDDVRMADLKRTVAASESIHVAPGETKELTWAFTGPEVPLYGCHVPGHWDAGMKGSFVLNE